MQRSYAFLTFSCLVLVSLALFSQPRFTVVSLAAAHQATEVPISISPIVGKWLSDKPEFDANYAPVFGQGQDGQGQGAFSFQFTVARDGKSLTITNLILERFGGSARTMVCGISIKNNAFTSSGLFSVTFESFELTGTFISPAEAEGTFTLVGHPSVPWNAVAMTSQGTLEPTQTPREAFVVGKWTGCTTRSDVAADNLYVVFAVKDENTLDYLEFRYLDATAHVDNQAITDGTFALKLQNAPMLPGSAELTGTFISTDSVEGTFTYNGTRLDWVVLPVE
jgi:hypothetical protein